jgi:nucleotide-binding universal stress UspA family protein
MHTIVAAVDVSPQAEPVIQALQTLNLHPDLTIVLAHILPPPPLEFDVPADVPRGVREERERLLAAEEFLHELGDDISRRAGDRLQHPVKVEIATGDPAEEIVRLASIHNADLVVLGTRGLAGVNRVILGSVSTAVVEAAPCSVYVVKPC